MWNRLFLCFLLLCSPSLYAFGHLDLPAVIELLNDFLALELRADRVNVPIYQLKDILF